MAPLRIASRSAGSLEACSPAEVARACRTAGLAATPQRLAILAALRSACDHPSPEALHERLRRARPDLSLATVYKALHAFAARGLAHEVSVAGDNRRRFDGNLDTHHHLVCEGCHEVRDLYAADLDRVRLPRRLSGFVASALSVNVLGRCQACVRAAPASRPRVARAPRRRSRVRGA